MKKVHGQQHGGGHGFAFGRVKLTLAFHGSVLPDGSTAATRAASSEFRDGKKVYDAADTGLFGDMRLIGEEGLDLAILPIGDNFTMGPGGCRCGGETARSRVRCCRFITIPGTSSPRMRRRGRPGSGRRPRRSPSS